MQRRAFITLLGGAVVAWPRTARSQSTMPVIGLLSSASPRGYEPMIARFRKGLGETGFVEGQNVRFEYRWADEQYDRLPDLAAQLVGDRVALILAATTPAALAAKPATKTIPIVFAIGGDPVRTGLVESLNHPAGNLTGAAHINVETAPKRLELMHELLPGQELVGLLINPTNPLSDSVAVEVRTAANTLGLKLQVVQAHTDEEIKSVFERLSELKIGALVIGTDPFFTSRAEQLAIISLRMKVPSIYQYRTFVEAGGIMSYGGSILDSYYRAGLYAGRILKGERPGDLPIQLTTKLELFLNLKSAEALGIKPPLSLLGRADEVIE